MKYTYILIRFNMMVLLSLMAGSCTNLDEEFYGRLSPENYYKTEEEALSSVDRCLSKPFKDSRCGRRMADS